MLLSFILERYLIWLCLRLTASIEDSTFVIDKNPTWLHSNIREDNWECDWFFCATWHML